MSEVPLSRESLSGWQGGVLALSVDGAILQNACVDRAIPKSLFKKGCTGLPQ